VSRGTLRPDWEQVKHKRCKIQPLKLTNLFPIENEHRDYPKQLKNQPKRDIDEWINGVHDKTTLNKYFFEIFSF